jgi:molybdopterin-guanine dinucleotide biosynthesis protein A
VTTTARTGPGSYDAVVLAGGAGRRLDGADKAVLVVGGQRLLDRVLDAVASAGRAVVVGPQRPVGRAVTWARESPAGAGPAAAVAAGLARVTAPRVVVLATDLPFLDHETVEVLLASCDSTSGAVLVDEDGIEQVLAGCWPTEALRARADAVSRERGDLIDCSARALLAGVPRRHVLLSAEDERPPYFDCDTPTDLRRARERA